MIKINWDLNGKEKKRILNLHESATKKQYLLKEGNGEKKEDFPKCVQSFGDPVLNSNGAYQINGTGDWEGYNFGFNGTYYDPNTQKGDGNYFCSGIYIVFGKPEEASAKGTKNVTNEDSDWSVVKNGEKVVGMGATGPVVMALQHVLAKMGWGDAVLKDKIGGVGCADDANKCDGKFGQSTKAAVIDFQKFHKLPTDGIVGKQVYSVLFVNNAKPTKQTKLPNDENFPACVTKRNPRISDGYGRLGGKYILIDSKEFYANGQVSYDYDVKYTYRCNGDQILVNYGSYENPV